MMLDRFNFKEWAYWGHLIKNLLNTWLEYALDWLLAKVTHRWPACKPMTRVSLKQNSDENANDWKMQSEGSYFSLEKREDHQSILGYFSAYPSFIWENNFWYGPCISNTDWRAKSQLKGCLPWDGKQKETWAVAVWLGIQLVRYSDRVWGLDIHCEPEGYRQVLQLWQMCLSSYWLRKERD